VYQDLYDAIIQSFSDMIDDKLMVYHIETKSAQMGAMLTQLAGGPEESPLSPALWWAVQETLWFSESAEIF